MRYMGFAPRGRTCTVIIHTGNRTDIPAFYMPWFLNRLREGYVLVRSPYDGSAVIR